MKSFIPTTVYGVLNYIVGILLMSSPWLFGFHNIGGASLFLPLLIGWFQLIMAIFGNNEVGFIKVFPLQMHFVLDVLAGGFLLTSPWAYGFAPHVFLPHLILGLLLVVLGTFTKKSPLTSATHNMLPEAGITSTDAHEGRLTT